MQTWRKITTGLTTITKFICDIFEDSPNENDEINENYEKSLPLCNFRQFNPGHISV